MRRFSGWGMILGALILIAGPGRVYAKGDFFAEEAYNKGVWR